MTLQSSTQPAAPRGGKASIKRVIKAVCAIALIVVLVRGVDWNEAQRVLATLTLWPLAFVLGAMILELAISAWRWQWSLRMLGIALPFAHLFDVLAKGYFINNLLPSAVGGDAYRVVRTMPQDGYKSRALAAVLVERAAGMLALLFLGAAGALVLFQEAAIARWYLGVCVVGGVCALAMGVIVQRGWLKPLTNRVRHLSAFDALEHNLARLRKGRKEWLYVAVLAVAFQMISILIVFGLFALVGRPVSVTACALMAAASGVAAILPISIAGIGVMEGSLVGMAVALGIDYDTATIVALLRRLMMVALGILCGCTFLFDRELAPSASTP